MTDISALIARSSIGALRVGKVVICGSRDLVISLDRIHDAMDSWLDCDEAIVPSEIVSGNARGVDRAGEQWAEAVGLPIKRFPVTPHEWRTIGRSAGPRRNEAMAKYADALLAFWDGKSRGTADMIDRMRARRKTVRVVAVGR